MAIFHQVLTAADPRVVDYRAVRDPELARSRGLLIAEGRLVLQRIVEDGQWTVRSVLVNEAARRDLEPTLARIPSETPVYVCEAAVLLGVTGHDIHRGCLALVERQAEKLLADVLASARLVIALEGVANADNVGGVFRNATAFGADAVLLSPGCCDPLYRKAVRTSMAATLRVPFVRLEAWPGALAEVRRAGFTLVALTPRPPSETLDVFAARPRPRKLALLVGTEGAGLTPAVEGAADYRVSIAIEPGVDSLNLAVATGIALYRLH